MLYITSIISISKDRGPCSAMSSNLLLLCESLGLETILRGSWQSHLLLREDYKNHDN